MPQRVFLSHTSDLGHANVQITADRYVHVTDRLQEQAAAKFSAYLAASVTEP